VEVKCRRADPEPGTLTAILAQYPLFCLLCSLFVFLFYKNGPFVSAGLVGHPRTRVWVGRAINGRHWVSGEGSAVASGRRVCFDGDRGRRIDVRKGIPFLDESGGPQGTE
jgi:hypothetical protein